MKKTVTTRLLAGEIIEIKRDIDGTWIIVQEETVKDTEMFVKVEASKLSLEDEFMKFYPNRAYEKELKWQLVEIIKSGAKDFYRPIMDPHFNGKGIEFSAGKDPAIGISYNNWIRIAKNFYPECNSRLGTRKEYIAFLGILIKELVATGDWKIPEAWDAVCYNSTKLGHYWNSENAKHNFECTGSRQIMGVYDLANTCKILADENNAYVFWRAGGSYLDAGTAYPLSDIECYDKCNDTIPRSVGWIVLEFKK